MGKSLTRKIIESHFVSGDMTPGKEIFIKVDQTLTHDINAVMTYLAFEAIGLDRRGRGSVRKDRGSLRIRLPDREERVVVHLREGKTLTESRKLAAAEAGQ